MSPQYCSTERKNVPEIELAEFQNIIYHVKPSPQDRYRSFRGHTLAGWAASLEATFINGRWEIANADLGRKPIHQIAFITGHLEYPEVSTLGKITFEGPIIDVPLALDEPEIRLAEPQSRPPHVGCGELLRLLMGEEASRELVHQELNETDDNRRIIVELLQDNYEPLARAISERRDPGLTYGLVVNETAMIFNPSNGDLIEAGSVDSSQLGNAAHSRKRIISVTSLTSLMGDGAPPNV
ncbi:hypothetical protein [Arthrobacter mobilis]|uniref:Uncharacterized protein n=1 Tax=Arthrobacter mobilis TaxID=2724944 RepID=A0A7X6K711_9MICC|nr:hypothetical protein [Arthrobacter mobilis]NKX56288.1 hypothetical protein [Arthrobacter mobilis]